MRFLDNVVNKCLRGKNFTNHSFSIIYIHNILHTKYEFKWNIWHDRHENKFWSKYWTVIDCNVLWHHDNKKGNYRWNMTLLFYYGIHWQVPPVYNMITIHVWHIDRANGVRLQWIRFGDIYAETDDEIIDITITARDGSCRVLSHGYWNYCLIFFLINSNLHLN